MRTKNNDKVKKTISKMTEHPKMGVRMVVFLTKVDFMSSQKLLAGDKK